MRHPGGRRPLRDLQAFAATLERREDLRRISQAVSPKLEVTELCRRALRADGPALLFENPTGSALPLIGNVFGSTRRIAQALGFETITDLRQLGELLAYLREPHWPSSMPAAMAELPRLSQALHARPRRVTHAPCQDRVYRGGQVDLAMLPVQTCWPEDAGPLITFGMVVTRGPNKPRQNIGIYRQQVIAPNKVIMRWLAQRGGALDFREWCQAFPGRPFPLAVVIGADPATTLAAVTPIPDTLSEYEYAGLLRGARGEVVRCRSHALDVPASAEIVLEGFIDPQETALEGPFGDHTGYYNAQDHFPVFTIECITTRDKPWYQGSYMGRSPEDEPSILAQALNEIYLPLLQKQFPEIIDFYLPPEACSYRVACISIRKSYPGHARRVMLGIWSYLRQFTYTKYVIVTDDDIDVRDWKQVIWALSTRADPGRDSLIVERSPVDYLDFSSPQAHLGGKIGFDATNKWPAETSRPWGRPIVMDAEVVRRMDRLWDDLAQSSGPATS